MSMEKRQSPIFSKTSEFLSWLLDHTEKFPKSERFRLARRLEDTAFNFYELLIKATRSQRKRRVLLEADFELEKIRLYIRLARNRKLTSPDQYRYITGILIEIGKLLGSWLKTVD